MMMVEFKLALAKIIIVALLIIIALLIFVIFALNKQISELISKQFSKQKDSESSVIE